MAPMIPISSWQFFTTMASGDPNRPSAGPNMTVSEDQTRTLFVGAIDHPAGQHNLPLFVSALNAGFHTMNQVLSGMGTLQQLVVNFFAGKHIPDKLLATIQSVAAGADKLLGTQIHVSNAGPLINSVLVAAGALTPAQGMVVNTVEQEVASYLNSIGKKV